MRAQTPTAKKSSRFEMLDLRAKDDAMMLRKLNRALKKNQSIAAVLDRWEIGIGRIRWILLIENLS